MILVARGAQHRSNCFLRNDAPVVVGLGRNRSGARQVFDKQIPHFLRRTIHNRQILEIISAAAGIPVIVDGHPKFRLRIEGRAVIPQPHDAIPHGPRQVDGVAHSRAFRRIGVIPRQVYFFSRRQRPSRIKARGVLERLAQLRSVHLHHI